MNEKVAGFFQISRFWLGVGAVLVLGLIGAICAAKYYQIKYVSLSESNKAAGGHEFIQLIEQHNNTAIGVHDNTVAATGEVRTALERADRLEQQRQRAYDFALLAIGEFTAIRDSMANAEITPRTAIELQYRIIEHVGRAEKYNRLVAAELGDCP